MLRNEELKENDFSKPVLNLFQYSHTPIREIRGQLFQTPISLTVQQAVASVLMQLNFFFHWSK